jgi:glycosyltransferase involved in cell wall biosynthesis
MESNDLRRIMLSSHVSLGQFENNDRLNRTIPHKAGESLALKLPYITGRSDGISELLVDGKSCLMVNLADHHDLANKIMVLRNDPSLARNLVDNGYVVYEKFLTPKVIGGELVRLFSDALNDLARAKQQ